MRCELVLLTEASAAIALSVLLGNVRLVELPNGGSIALATIPLLALAVVRGVRLGVLAGFCAGIAHVLAGGTIVHPAQLLLDYPIAYAALGLAGLAHGSRGRSVRRSSIALAVAVAMAGHLAAMVTSGVIFFAAVGGSAAIWYSLAYNAATVVPEAVLGIWLVPGLVTAIARANPADAWRRGLVAPPPRSLRTPRRHAVGTGPVASARSRPAPAPRLPSLLLRPAPFPPLRSSGRGPFPS